MEFRELTIKEFEKYLNKSNLKSFLQSPKLDGQDDNSYYVGVLKAGKVIAATRMISKKNRFGYNNFYAPKGLLLDYNDIDLLKFFILNLKKYIKHHHGYVLHIDPNVFYKSRDIDGNITDEYDNTNIVNNLKRLGFKHNGFTVGYDNTNQVRWQHVIDLEGKTFEEIKKSIKANHLNKIKKAEKYGITVKEIEYDDLPIFKSITESTSKQIGFKDKSIEYYRKIYKNFKNEVKFLLAYLNVDEYKKKITDELISYNKKYEKFYNKENNSAKEIKKNIDTLNNRLIEIDKYESGLIPISASMFMVFGDEIIYLFSGNVDKYNNFYSQYLIQWIMIKYALENKYKKYNFYGISGKFNPGEDGVYEFKKGFGGHVEEYIGDFYLPINWYYYLNELLNKIRRKNENRNK